MVVIPRLDLIVAWNDAEIHSREDENRALGLLVEAVTDTASAHRQR
jgi:hypothetical protein